MGFFANACLPAQTSRPSCLHEQLADKFRMTLIFMGHWIGGLGCGFAVTKPPYSVLNCLSFWAKQSKAKNRPKGACLTAQADRFTEGNLKSNSKVYRTIMIFIYYCPVKVKNNLTPKPQATNLSAWADRLVISCVGVTKKEVRYLFWIMTAIQYY